LGGFVPKLRLPLLRSKTERESDLDSIPISPPRFLFTGPQSSHIAGLIQTHLVKQVLQEKIRSPF
jgi:hypothetical protein